MIILRSLLFNAAFYLVLIAYFVVAIPTLVMPRWGIIRLAQQWGRVNLALLRIVCGITVEWRGLDKIPAGAVLVAAKHQSLWETFALLTRFDDPTYILKRELLWIPFFGWYARHAGMIPVDRGGGKPALIAMAARVRDALVARRQIIVFPEGTRRPPGAEPKYKYGIAHLYAECGAPCVPIALNSGLFWPRRRFLRYPGTITVEVLDPIAPGLAVEHFFARLQREIETATARLIAQAARGPAAG
ncbi:MAG: 1-acyl-sn-glycerol-3-phosphate acyltransferase [Acetobacteraceae bacterium]|nr:1-acyl-sn-glycerol-3-phosphate acyltransferase [Acetobacteraceae bacterium]